jgi:fido (protein-threonine AMPylation protein)
MKEKNKYYRLWEHIEFHDKWKKCDTSQTDDIAPSWFHRREVLQENSQEFQEFIARLKREHAIETGVVEKMYDLEKGITETFIKKGFLESYISNSDTDIPVPKLLSHLNDHIEAIDFIFDIVKENRKLTVGFIKELHALVTRNQKYVEGRDQFGNKTQMPLLSGEFKEWDNNPSREDGTIIQYCPPEHVRSEMDNLVYLYKQASESNIHPIIISAWFHHSFTIIHPFQDGNGRVARLLSSLILIKNGFFPFTVLREEAKEKYIEALEQADKGEPQQLVDYFSEVQKRHIEKALNIREVSSTSFEEVSKIFSGKLEQWQQWKEKEREEELNKARMKIFEYCKNYIYEAYEKLNPRLNGNAKITIEECPPNDQSKQHYYYGQIIKYAKKHDYFFNRNFPKSWLMFRIDMPKDKSYQLGISIHHYGYDDSTIAIGAFLEYLHGNNQDRIDSTLPLDIKPHVISITKDIDAREKNIKAYLENVLTLTLAQIASEF